mmetsp:Transcript_17495/g.37815  ORF Transcript_17495/g.37815 Transcript_17495/m.37815 type:complete len:166 (+) Transcript_17495:1313-1810(+)
MSSGVASETRPIRYTLPGLTGEFLTEAKSRAFLTFPRGRLRSEQRTAVRAWNSFSASVVSGTSISESSIVSSVVTITRVVVRTGWSRTTFFVDGRGNLDGDNFSVAKVGCGLGNDVRASQPVNQRVAASAVAKTNGLLSRAAAILVLGVYEMRAGGREEDKSDKL